MGSTKGSKRTSSYLTNTENDPIKKIKNDIRKKIGKDHLKVEPKTYNQGVFMNEIQNPEAMYVIATGIAGAGKSYLALVEAINLLLDDTNKFTKIRIFKPLKQLQGEDIGILPGGVEEKLEYVLMSYSIQLKKMIHPIVIETLFKEGIIEIIPMGNLRGLSLDNINIFDEFQNVSIDNTETVLTRLEEDGKMIIIGDIRQRDFKDKHDNGLLFLTQHFNDFDDRVKVIEFNDSDCVRSPLIQKITKVFDEHKPAEETKTFLNG